MWLSFKSGLSKALRTDDRARVEPVALALPMMAVPLLCKTVLASRRSMLTL